jgi:hypothetical protein
MQQALLAPVNKDDRPRFSGRSTAGIVMIAQEPALLRVCGERPGEVRRVNRSGEPRPPQPCDGARAERSASPVCAAHAECVAALARHPPRTIPVDADAIDLEDRADHLSKVFSALSVYLAVIIDDTAQNVPGRIDLPDTEAILADLASDVTGTIQHAAEGMGWRDE